MPPIRRYIRISPHSCLEVRIFLDDPADISTWLLRPSNPALPRVFNAVKPLILPKLKEENERTRLAKGKSGKKKKGVKDVVKGDDFEIVIFLTEGQGRHEVVVKRKEARDTSSAGPGGKREEPVVIPEEDGESDVDMNAIPMANDDDEGDDDEVETRQTRSKGKRSTREESQFEDEKKKLGFKTEYDGFSIWGKVLCLLVERKGGPSRRHATNRGKLGDNTLLGDGKLAVEGAQQALMQEWISSTQLPQDDDELG